MLSEGSRVVIVLAVVVLGLEGEGVLVLLGLGRLWGQEGPQGRSPGPVDDAGQVLKMSEEQKSDRTWVWGHWAWVAISAETKIKRENWR